MLIPLIYLDTGVLSRLKGADFQKYNGRLAFSFAHLADLKNSSSAGLELQYLKDTKSTYIWHELDGTVLVDVRDPFLAFESLDVIGFDAIAEITSFFSGGGPDRTAKQSIDLSLQTIEHVAISDLCAADGDVALGISNREIEKSLNQLSSKVPKTTSDNVLHLEELPLELRIQLPEGDASFDNLMAAASFLKLLHPAQSRGIRSQSRLTSSKVASHDNIDMFHVVYGLHCQFFITNDKSAYQLAVWLKQHWSMSCNVVLQTKA